jgi:hypothetical protein
MEKPELSGVDVGGRPATSVAANSSGLAAGAVGDGCGVGVVVGTGVLVGSGVLVLVGGGVSVGAGVSVGVAGAGVSVGAGGGAGVGGTAGAAIPHPANRTAITIVDRTRTEIDRQLNTRMSVFTPSFQASWRFDQSKFSYSRQMVRATGLSDEDIDMSLSCQAANWERCPALLSFTAGEPVRRSGA